MLVRIGLGILWACMLSLVAPAASSPGHHSVSGSDYVRVNDWARTRNFDLSWPVPRQQFLLSGRAGKLSFTIDSRRMELNGMSAYLSLPAALVSGGALIGAMDLKTLIDPLLNPSKSSANRVRTIVLDPGHGGKDPGSRSGKQYEAKYALLLAKELSVQLKKAGFTVVLTRSTDRYVEHSARTEIARKRQGDLFISLHFNSTLGSGVKGLEVYCLTPAYASSTNARGEGADTGRYPGNRFDPQNVLLAHHVQRSILRIVPMEDRGLRRARFAVLRAVQMPAVLVEGGFLTNRGEGERIDDARYRRQLAQGIVEGVRSYKRAVEM